MPVATKTWELSTPGGGQLLDLTSQVSDAIAGSGLKDGIATLFVRHTTAAICITEFESGLLKDFQELQERWIPAHLQYQHNVGGRDDNAHAHLRSTQLGASITVPFTAGRLQLGTWQRLALVDFDTSPRFRQVICQLLGE